MKHSNNGPSSNFDLLVKIIEKFTKQGMKIRFIVDCLIEKDILDYEHYKLLIKGEIFYEKQP